VYVGGFLQVHILAVAGRLDPDQGVPVVRRRDTDRVDIGPRQQFAEVVIRCAACVPVPPVHVLLGLFPERAPQVADGRDAHVLLGRKTAQMTAAHAAHADAARRPRRLFARIGDG